MNKMQTIPNSKLQPPKAEGRGSWVVGWGARFVVLFLALWTSCAFSAQSTNSPTPPDFSSFKLVTERNIFNTRRSAAYKAADRPGPTRRAQKTESFALVGTMNDREGPLAFFEGSRSDYRKVLKHNETI